LLRIKSEMDGIEEEDRDLFRLALLHGSIKTFDLRWFLKDHEHSLPTLRKRAKRIAQRYYLKHYPRAIRKTARKQAITFYGPLSGSASRRLAKLVELGLLQQQLEFVKGIAPFRIYRMRGKVQQRLCPDCDKFGYRPPEN